MVNIIEYFFCTISPLTGAFLFRQILKYAHLTLFNKINLHSVVIHVIFVTSN